MAIRISESGYFYGACVVVGAAITYGFSIVGGLIEAILQGAIWGAIVGASVAQLIDSAMNFSKEKWHLVGWLAVAALYGYWVVFHYKGDPDMSPTESIYWDILGWSLASYLIGWLALGTLLASHMNRKKP